MKCKLEVLESSGYLVVHPAKGVQSYMWGTTAGPTYQAPLTVQEQQVLEHLRKLNQMLEERLNEKNTTTPTHQVPLIARLVL